MTELCGPALSTFGLGLDIVGAWMLARGVIITRQHADLLAGSHWDKNKDLERMLLKQSRDARIGVAILTAGFLLQILGAWAGTDLAQRFLW